MPSPEPGSDSAAALPLSTLLSHALVAFTIEFENEFERWMPHRTARFGGTDGPWLVSMVTWFNCMRFVGEEGLTVRELERLARTKTNLDGMRRWGYLSIEPGSAGSRPKPRPGSLLRATAKGRMAREVWQPLFGVIEERRQARSGADEIEQLREALLALISRFDTDLPDCLPILGYGLFSRGPESAERTTPATDRMLPLAALLSRALLAFAIEYERESDWSLAVGANVLRVLDADGVPLRDLPLLSGVSKEAISMALGVLQKKQAVVIAADPSSRAVKLVRLTPKGRADQDAWRRRLGLVEKAGNRSSAKRLSVPFESHWSGWTAVGPPRPHLCSEDWNLIPTAGGRPYAGPKPCRTTPWCCTAADFPMAVDRWIAYFSASSTRSRARVPLMRKSLLPSFSTITSRPSSRVVPRPV
jgi:DNA-binding MarR family transcriptional regulator